jgi:hypothetical protein
MLLLTAIGRLLRILRIPQLSLRTGEVGRGEILNINLHLSFYQIIKRFSFANQFSFTI